MELTSYLAKNGWLPCPAEIKGRPELIVVIPASREPAADLTVLSLSKCENPGCGVSVFVVVNQQENAPSETILQNRNCISSLEAVKFFLPEWLSLTILEPPSFPEKFAGPGLARKVGMDEAARWFSETKNSQGVILSLDADSTVAPDYFKSVKTAFSDASVRAVSIYFEHPLSGSDSPGIYEAITRYELYLRYYIQALRQAGYPFAYQTIGSSFAVRADVYARSGGMNKRKAGEDFYFLHKLIPDGGFFDLTATTVFPSPRISDRVPFGTGRAVMDYVDHGDPDYPVYHPDIFDDIKKFLEIRNLDSFSSGSITEFLDSLPPSLQICRNQRAVDRRLTEIRLNSSSPEAFKKRFLKWFDGFEVLKWVHLLRDEVYGTMPVNQASAQLIPGKGISSETNDTRELLIRLREVDRSEKFTIIF